MRAASDGDRDDDAGDRDDADDNDDGLFGSLDSGSTFSTSATATSSFSRDVDLDRDDVLAVLALGGGLRHRGFGSSLLLEDALLGGGFGTFHRTRFLDDDVFGHRVLTNRLLADRLFDDGLYGSSYIVSGRDYRGLAGPETVMLVVNATTEGPIFTSSSGISSVRDVGDGVTRVRLDDGRDVLIVVQPEGAA